MNLEHLRTFRTVVDQGSFSRAAAALRVSQSTVSFHIKALESETGARLLDRAGRTTRPTSTGRVLLGFARRILSLQDEALARLAAEEGGRGGRVTIAASTVPAEYLLPPRLAAFRREHPNVSLVIDVSDSQRAAAALLAEACDLAIVGASAPVRDRRIVSTRFAEDQVVLVGPASGPLATGALDRASLAGVPLVLREQGSGTRAAVARLVPAEIAYSERPGQLRVGSTESARRSVLAGLGFTFISRTAVADDLAAGRLRVVRYPGTPLHRNFHLARLRASTPSAAARALIRHLAAGREA